MDLTTLLTSFEGRINRAKWWLGWLVMLILEAIAWIVAYAVAGFPTEANHPGLVAFAVIHGIFGLVLLYMMLAIYTKRWHDRGKSGWWTLIILIPIIGGIWILIELGILEGTRGPNQYGPDPLGQ
jgi:uncharacterized membrane protein YhaH (DUF805 family)